MTGVIFKIRKKKYKVSLIFGLLSYKLTFLNYEFLNDCNAIYRIYFGYMYIRGYLGFYACPKNLSSIKV